MSALTEPTAGVGRTLKRIGALVASVALMMGVTSAPASATTWYQCYIDHQYYNYSYWTWCYDDPYYSGAVRDQHGNAYYPVRQYTEDFLYLYSDSGGWDVMGHFP